jgi:hypothetical protein
MREEKVIMDFPEAAEKIIAANSQVSTTVHFKDMADRQVHFLAYLVFPFGSNMSLFLVLFCC